MTAMLRFPFVLVALALTAQPPAPAQQPAVTFKVEINYVEIDAVVTDAQGNFVRGLTKEDFQVTEEGTRQAIAAFCMGSAGRISRIMAPLLGSAIDYVSLDREEASAPGQLTIHELRVLNRIMGG